MSRLPLPTTSTSAHLRQLDDAIAQLNLQSFLRHAKQLNGAQLSTRQLSTLTRPPPLFACITDVSVENKPLRELFVELLLRLGADPNAVDAGGLSAADTARAACFDEAVELLQRWSGPVEPREDSVAAQLLALDEQGLANWIEEQQRDEDEAQQRYEEAQRLYQEKLKAYNARLAQQAPEPAAPTPSQPSVLPPLSPPPSSPPKLPLPTPAVDPKDVDSYTAIRLVELAPWPTEKSLLGVLEPILPSNSILNLFIGIETEEYKRSALLAVDKSVASSSVISLCQGLTGLTINRGYLKVQEATRRVLVSCLPLGSTDETVHDLCSRSGVETLDVEVFSADSGPRDLSMKASVTLRSYKRCLEMIQKMNKIIYGGRALRVTWANEDVPGDATLSGSAHSLMMVNPQRCHALMTGSGPAPPPLPTVPSPPPTPVNEPSSVVNTEPVTTKSRSENFSVRLSHLSSLSTDDSIRSALPMAPPYILAVDLVRETDEFGRSAFVTFDSKLDPKDVVARLAGFNLDGSFIIVTEESPSVLATGLSKLSTMDEIVRIVRGAGLEAISASLDSPRATLSFATFEECKRAILALNGYRSESWTVTARWDAGCLPASTYGATTKRRASVAFTRSPSPIAPSPSTTKSFAPSTNRFFSPLPSDLLFSHPMLAGVFESAPRDFKVLRISHLGPLTDAATIKTFFCTLFPSKQLGSIAFMQHSPYAQRSVLVRLDPAATVDNVVPPFSKGRLFDLDGTSVWVQVAKPAINMRGFFPDGGNVGTLIKQIGVKPTIVNVKHGFVTFETYQEAVRALRLLWDVAPKMGVRNLDIRWAYDDILHEPDPQARSYFDDPPRRTARSASHEVKSPDPTPSDPRRRRPSIASSPSVSSPPPPPSSSSRTKHEPTRLVVKSLPTSTSRRGIIDMLREVVGLDTDQYVESVKFRSGRESKMEAVVKVCVKQEDVDVILSKLDGAMMDGSTVRVRREEDWTRAKKRAKFAPPTPSLSPAP